MTSNMRNAIEQAAYEIGVATAKYDMLVGNSAMPTALVEPAFVPVMKPRKRGRVAKAPAGNFGTIVTELPPMPKAPVIARGVKKASAPRTKGVKEAIVSLVSEGGNTTADIIAKTGFKPASVNATLMSLKKDGLAIKIEGKLWSAGSAAYHEGKPGLTGNSDHAEAKADYQETY